jgi:tetraacyldisaccharide 4'-kinase
LNILSGLYGRVLAASRARYERDPERRRRLHHPVISVGNLAAGGSGKTPVVAALAGILGAAGRNPAVLSRGYRRRSDSDGAVVVSDGRSVLQPVDVSGDEPQMLARTLPGVPVVVCADRYLAGRLAEQHLGADVHILDDGFQHWPLERAVDLVVVSADDLDGTLLPAGHLREPLDAAQRATAVLVPGDDADVERVCNVLGHPAVFQVRRRFEAARLVRPFGGAFEGTPGPAIAVAGIARPRRFFDAARAEGWDVRKEVSFRDHHWFTAGDVAGLVAMARQLGVTTILTTAKDAVRLEARAGAEPTWAYLPMQVSIEPEAAFTAWLLARLGMA